MIEERVKALTESLLDTDDLPSIQTAILRSGEVIYSAAEGYADREGQVKADAQTQYAIGSVTKTFATTAIGLLVERGLVSWDDPVKKVLPEFEMYDRHLTHQVTLRDIASHRTGLPRHDFMFYQYDKPESEIVNTIREMEPAVELRSRMIYQNHMFILIGVLVEKLSGMKWQAFVKENLLDPLGMDATTFSVSEMVARPNYALPYAGLERAERIPFKCLDNFGMAAAMNSTSEDLLKWLAFHLGNGEWNGKQIIAPERLLECHTPQTIIGSRLPWKLPYIDFECYGLGWYVESYRGEKVIYHSGHVNGFASLVSFVPGRKIAFAINCNKTFSLAPMTLQYCLYDLLFGLEPVDWRQKFHDFSAAITQAYAAELRALRAQQSQNTQPSLSLDAYAGCYRHPAHGDIHVKAGQDALYIDYGELQGPLEHLCYDTFLVTVPVELFQSPIKFRLDEKGEVEALEMKVEPVLHKYLTFTKQAIHHP
jgi:CubicO group peptidase (beta-lactamase class C family)